MLDTQAGLEFLGGVLDSLSYPNRVLSSNEDQSEGVDVIALHNLLMKGCFKKHDEEIGEAIPQQTLQHDPEAYVILVRTLTGKTICIRVKPTTTIAEVKKEVLLKVGIPVDLQRLIFSGVQMEDEETVGDNDIQRCNTLHLTLRLLGGGYPLINLPPNLLNSRFHFDFGDVVDQKTFYRGGTTYIRPCGWFRFALDVNGKYSDDVWLIGKKSRRSQYSSAEGEWPVSYHGTSYHNGLSIAAEGFQLSKSKRFKFGKGIYSTPDVNIALLYAQTVTFKGDRYKLVMQNRINPENLLKICKNETGDGEYWISPSERDVRPYGFCVKKVD